MFASVKTSKSCKSCQQLATSFLYEDGKGYVCESCFYGKPMPERPAIEPLVIFG